MLLANRVRSGRPIGVVCHRGANEYAPENTYASAARCIEWGMDVLEVDVNMSLDGELLLFHGPGLERTTNGTGRINTTHSTQLAQLDVGSWFAPEFADERMPRLDEFLAWVDHRIALFFDVKRADLSKFVALIHATGYAESCFVWFGNPAKAREFHALAPELPLKINVSHPDEVMSAKVDFGAALVEVGLRDATPAMVTACRDAGVKLMVLQLPYDPNAYRQVLDLGADFVNLDHADRFVQELARWDAEQGA